MSTQHPPYCQVQVCFFSAASERRFFTATKCNLLWIAIVTFRKFTYKLDIIGNLMYCMFAIVIKQAKQVKKSTFSAIVLGEFCFSYFSRRPILFLYSINPILNHRALVGQIRPDTSSVFVTMCLMFF